MGSWAISFLYEFPADTWQNLGLHNYGFRVECPELQAMMAGEWINFMVSNQARLLDSPVYLRLNGLSLGLLAPAGDLTIHPDQATIAVVTIVGITQELALAAANSPDCELIVGWDDLKFAELVAGEPFQP